MARKLGNGRKAIGEKITVTCDGLCCLLKNGGASLWKVCSTCTHIHLLEKNNFPQNWNLKFEMSEKHGLITIKYFNLN